MPVFFAICFWLVSDKYRDIQQTRRSDSSNCELDELLNTKSAKELESKRNLEEIDKLLGTPSIKEKNNAQKFKSNDGLKIFCDFQTRRRCPVPNCQKIHFKKIIKPHTQEHLGDCSFLNNCFNHDTCKYVHYEIEKDSKEEQKAQESPETGKHHPFLPHFIKNSSEKARPKCAPGMIEPQWINCDIRHLDLTVLGKYTVIMADPPWDIHMELPYGTMKDEEMRNLRIQDLSDDGLFFLWVTGRAMELGRELLRLWGYTWIDEITWVKINQLQRLIRTGRTGHWLNHGKEHCLVGIKGSPPNLNRGLDCDVLVAEVRDTSHKPDEIYGIIERLTPGTKKLELFGRMHNIQPNWVTVGNQLEGVHIHDQELVRSFRTRYPDGHVRRPKN
ncbi:Oidioi.mRNA.OKI2018_I69.PAR.g9740.t1.cds [Oikopleura dioica]|uniref:mRNA m(6)A methyltransferase n=1 Tax=Oikopleura dioica TaxID=34765 RepID=A0ABN7RN22_OIKDI|nr:Oidioi.mRNA.OKI2018_I69.PAR.g9740.t1.cds [Oikopleura dioica]